MQYLNEVVTDPVRLILYKIAYPRPSIPQDIIRAELGVVSTPTTGVDLTVVTVTL